MRVAFINPMAKGMKVTIEPLNLGYLAGYLELHGIEVKIIDQMAGDDIKKEISAYHPDIVGITSMTPMVLDAYRIADMCRRMKILTILGGPHPSALPEEALEHADIVVTGEGEAAMLAIVKEGLTSGIVSRPYLNDLDALPLHPRHLMKQGFYLGGASETKKYMLAFLGPALASIKSAALLTSRGCPLRCIFCRNSLRQSPVRFYSAERVMEEIKRLKADYGVAAMIFLDENFLVNKPRLEKICQAMINEKLGILWGCMTSSHYLDRTTARMIREAGCRQVNFGIESGSQRMLDILGKSTTVEQNKEAIRACKETGLLVAGSFMIGNPKETIEDVRLTQQFMRENELDSYRVNITTPYPGTKIWEQCKEQIPKPFNWKGFDQSNFRVYPYSPFSKATLGKLFLETALVKPCVSPRDWKTALRYPKESLRWLFRHPITAVKIVLGRYDSRKMKIRRNNKIVKREEISLGYKCNARCRFCFYDCSLKSPLRSVEEIRKDIRAATRYGIEHIELSGGEPMLHTEIYSIVKFCKGQGFKTICMITNGSLLKNRDTMKSLQDAGLNEFVFSLHGADAQMHDYLTRAQTYHDILQAIDHAKALG
ncbi:MAG: radical SAM protein, partial [Candidatus Omnitrophica bacterium]|nr:radical SAM protein [Candidatus Omnitrophota bacterium]